jgi:hypothetical protein
MPSAGPYIDFDVYATVGGQRQTQIPAGAANPTQVIEIRNRMQTLPLDVRVAGAIQPGSNSGLLAYASANQSWPQILVNVQAAHPAHATEGLSRAAQAAVNTHEYLCCTQIEWRQNGAPGWSNPVYPNPGCSQVTL